MKKARHRLAFFILELFEFARFGAALDRPQGAGKDSRRVAGQAPDQGTLQSPASGAPRVGWLCSSRAKSQTPFCRTRVRERIHFSRGLCSFMRKLEWGQSRKHYILQSEV